MAKMTRKQENASRRAGRARAKVLGTAERPRLSVFISNRHVVAQIINDLTGETLSYSTSEVRRGEKGKTPTTGEKLTMSEKAAKVGVDIAGKAKKLGITKVVFDRGSKIYAGRLSKLASAAREKGLEF